MQSPLEALYEYYKTFSTLDLNAIVLHFSEPRMSISPQGVFSAGNRTELTHAFGPMREEAGADPIPAQPRLYQYNRAYRRLQTADSRPDANDGADAIHLSCSGLEDKLESTREAPRLSRFGGNAN